MFPSAVLLKAAAGSPAGSGGEAHRPGGEEAASRPASVQGGLWM